MWTSPPPFGRAHYLADLRTKIELTRTSYRFYIAENVYVFEQSKLNWLETELINEAFEARDRDAVLLIIDAHAQLRRTINPTGLDLDAIMLLIRFDLGLHAISGSPA